MNDLTLSVVINRSSEDVPLLCLQTFDDREIKKYVNVGLAELLKNDNN